MSSPGKEGTEVPGSDVVVGAGHGGEGTAPEVVGAEDGDGGVLGNALHQVTPLARQLVGSLAALHTCYEGKLKSLFFPTVDCLNCSYLCSWVRVGRSQRVCTRTPETRLRIEFAKLTFFSRRPSP